jgi:hypothetical protein
MYRAPSGAKVFGAGTVQWAWGLDDWNPSFTAPDRNMQQATVNLLADLKAQPATRQANLTAAAASTDTTGPTSTVTSPPTTVADGTKVTLTGTATDTGGGVVAGVEVSTDGGTTWHPATSGTASWTYSWIAHGYPSTVIKTRASDDSGNIGATSAGSTVNVTCACSIWGPNVTPGTPDSGDATAVEVGVRFKADRFGTVTGLRFYKAAANTGTHIGSLWTEGGTRLAQATFTSESASGWQTVTFPSPVAISANTKYIASYHAPNGHYAATGDYFWRAPAPGPNGGAITDSPPLHALKSLGSDQSGVFSYASTSTFPTDSFGATNYWVDVSFVPAPAPGAVSNLTAAASGSTSAHVSWTAPSTGGTVTSYTITPYVGTTAQPSTTITGTPPATDAVITGLTQGTTYTFSVHASNPTGDGPESAKSGAVTPTGPVAPLAPTNVTATPASTSARVTWSAPSADGDSAITGYTVTPFDGSTALTPVATSASARSVTVTGLDNGTPYTFRVTATNAIGTSPASAASAAVTPQATVFDLAVPSTVDAGDSSSVELGVKVKSDFSGSITGIRFYKATANTGTHVGSLWTVGGTRLAQATFTNESASGWQTATFATPVSVTAGTTYVASYFAPSGHYSVGAGLSAGADNPPLHALADSSSANGVYAYSSTGGFPNSSYNASNYFVDVMFSMAKPGTPTGVTASNPARTTADVAWTAPSTGGGVTSYKVTPYIGTTAQTPTTVSGIPAPTSTTISGLTADTAYTFTVQASNGSGSGPASAASNTVTTSSTATPPGAPTNVIAKPASQSALVSWTPPATIAGDPPLTGFVVTPYIGTTAQTATTVGASATSTAITGLTNGTSYTFKVAATNSVGTGNPSTASAVVVPRATIFDFGTPSTVDVAENSSLVLGAKFTSDVDGSITGVRFYKAAANTGTHVGSLWSAAGALLASTTFSGETASGWQTALFTTPVAIAANTTYVVSYLSPNGHYSADGGTFSSSPFDNAPLHALSTLNSPNGVYAYSPTSIFPTNSYNAANYWVDVLFAAGS